MNADFAQAIDPLFEHALTTIDAIESGESRDAADEQATLLALIDRVDRQLGHAPQWQYARYALIVWMDEIFLSLPWDGASWWREHVLEMSLYQSRNCSVRFFELARAAAALPDRDALEVYYNCVLLGFRGMYAEGALPPHRSQSQASVSGDFSSNVTLQKTELAMLADLPWPPTIAKWLEQTAQWIDVAPQIPWDADQPMPLRSIEGARPDVQHGQLVWWTMMAVVLLLVHGAIFRFL